MVISFLAMRSTSGLILILSYFSLAKIGADPWTGFLSIIACSIFSLIHKVMSFAHHSGIELVVRSQVPFLVSDEFGGLSFLEVMVLLV